MCALATISYLNLYSLLSSLYIMLYLLEQIGVFWVVLWRSFRESVGWSVYGKDHWTTRKACIGYMEKFGNGPFRSSCYLILCVNKVKLRAKVLIVDTWTAIVLNALLSVYCFVDFLTHAGKIFNPSTFFIILHLTFSSLLPHTPALHSSLLNYSSNWYGYSTYI